MYTRYKSVFALFVVFASAQVFCVEGNASFKAVEQLLTVETRERSYRVFAPRSLKSEAVPLMLVLHGGMGSGKGMEKTSGMNRIARKNKFVVAYPDGIGGRLGLMKNMRTWNAGACCGRAVKEKVDDVSYLLAVIDDIASKYPIDKKRVYITGISNGAMMAYRMACEVPEKVAAIAPVAGTLALSHCPNGTSVPVLHIHGDNDSNVPIAGGKGKSSIAGVEHRSVTETIKMLAEARRCDKPVEQADTDSVVSAYRCKSGAPVLFRLVKGGEHTWPMGEGRRDKKMFNGRFSGSQAVWDFVSQYAK